MVEFKTQYNGRVRRTAAVGSPIHEEFVGSYDSNGRLKLTPNGTTNIYDKIQSFKDSCDINMIVKRFTEGDVSVLSKVQGFYGDFSGMPGSYSQLLNTVESGKRKFESLPVEVRDVFGQNFALFMDSLMDGSVVEKLRKAGFVKDEKVSPEVSKEQKDSD